MCRNIKTLFNFEPPATDDEIRAASIQFVRKLAGFSKPSKVNEAVFNQAVEEIAATSRTLIDSLETNARPKDARSRPSESANGRRSVLRRL